MKKSYYINHNLPLGLQYKTSSLEEIIAYTSDITLSLCSSYINVEIFDNLKHVSHNGTNSIITKSIYYNELINEDSGGCIDATYNSAKKEFIQNISKVDVNSSGSDELFGECDIAPVLAAKEWNGVVVASDYHEAAYALCLGVPYIFRILETSLEKFNGLKNYRFEHIKRVNNLVKEIINKKI